MLTISKSKPAKQNAEKAGELICFFYSAHLLTAEETALLGLYLEAKIARE